MYNIFKFRAWSFEHSQMIYSDTEIEIGLGNSLFQIDEKGIYLQVLRKNIESETRIYKSGLMSDYEYYTPEQDIMISTGMYDIHKKLIYQGDIIKCIEPDFNGHVGGTGYHISQIFYNAIIDYYNGSFYYYPNGNMKQPHAILSAAFEIEVLGNIYENKNLIND